MRYRVSARLLSPLAISTTQAGGNFLQTLPYIPGSVWRGALAARAIRERGLKQPETDTWFRETFLEGKFRFGDLRVRGGEVWPLSGRQCRQYGTLHGDVDFLIGAARQQSLIEECPACEAKLEHPRQFMVRHGQDWKGVEPRTRITGHSAIDPWTMRAADGQLFQTVIVERGEIFSGTLWVDEAVVRGDHKPAEEFQTSRLTLGRGSTRGQGIAELHLNPAEIGSEVEAKKSLRNRLHALNDVWGKADEVVFSVTLGSPCIVLDRWLLSRAYPSPDDLAEACGGPAGTLDGYRLVSQYSQWTRTAGWNAQAGLPKSSEPAIAAGSSFLFSKRIDPGHRDQELNRLAELFAAVDRGIGERWDEGFGEAVFCHEYHFNRQKGAVRS